MLKSTILLLVIVGTLFGAATSSAGAKAPVAHPTENGRDLFQFEALLNDTFHSAHVSAHDLNFSRALVRRACQVPTGKRISSRSCHSSWLLVSSFEPRVRAFEPLGTFQLSYGSKEKQSLVTSGNIAFRSHMGTPSDPGLPVLRSVTPSPLVVRFRCIIGALDSDAQRDARLRPRSSRPSSIGSDAPTRRSALLIVAQDASDVVGVRREAAQPGSPAQGLTELRGVSLRQGGAITARITTTEPLPDAKALVDRLRQGGVHGKAVIRT